MLTVGDPAPWFTARSTVNPKYTFDTAAGRYLVLCFFGSAANPASRRVLDDIERNRHRFDVENALFFGVTADPDDESLQRVRQQLPGVLFFWDFDLAVSRLYGVVSPDGTQYQPQTLLLNPGLRTLAVLPFDNNIENHVPTLLRLLDSCPSVKNIVGFPPVIFVPNIFEPELCRTLIGLYEQHGGQETGVMRDTDGKTFGVADHTFKRRTDYYITDPNIIEAAQARLQRRLFPEIKKAFQFNVAHIERYIVACYDASIGGYFRPHRDDTTIVTAHRKFAVTLNLNVDYDSGGLRFPEFAPMGIRAPTGGAVVFSCSLLHEALPITKGKRYAFLPFLYDEEGAKMLQANLHLWAGNTAPLQS